eukprot:jgi/Botrbrau1/13978/Bobra.117_2s0008.1
MGSSAAITWPPHDSGWPALTTHWPPVHRESAGEGDRGEAGMEPGSEVASEGGADDFFPDYAMEGDWHSDGGGEPAQHVRPER